MNILSLIGRRKHNVKRLVVHIGSHKTGTTYLQRLCEFNRTKLLDKSILFPVTGFGDPKFKKTLGSTSGHAALAGLHKNKDSNESIIKELGKEIRLSGAETVVLSSESFFGNKAVQSARIIADALNIDELHIIVFLRRQDLYLESLYKERLRWNNGNVTSDISEFLLGRGSGLMSYYDRISGWLEFPEAKLSVFPYDDLMAGKGVKFKFLESITHGDFYGDFVEPPKGHENLSIDDRLSGLLALINKNIKINDQQRTKLIRIISAANLTESSSATGLLSYDQRLEIKQTYSVINKSFEEKYFKMSAPIFCFEKEFRDVPILKQLWEISDVQKILDMYES